MSDIPIAEYYYKKLQEDGNKIVLLVSFCKAVFGDEIVTKSFYGRIGRLVNVYGYRSVYFSILGLIGLQDADGEKLLNYIAYNCKKRLETSAENRVFNDLTGFINSTKESLQKTKDLQIPDRSMYD